MDFLTQVAPGIAALLIAIAGVLTQRIKDQQRQKVVLEKEQKLERTAITVKDTLDLYESTVRELRSREQDLTKKVEAAERQIHENHTLIHKLNEKIDACEQKSATIESQADRLKDEVRTLQATKATLNTQMAALILELEQLTGAIKARGVKNPLETTTA